MTDQQIIAGAIGAILSFILQFLKRWVVFTGTQVKGFIFFLGVIYAVAVFAFDGVTIRDMLLNIGSFILANQGLFALIFNNTEFGERVAGVEE